jgi:23S rRNA (pseudouridine1915-N3)-methyltransferase
MTITVAVVVPSKKAKLASADALVQEYVARTRHYLSCEEQFFPSEDSLFEFVSSRENRAPARLILMDGGGRALTSENFARLIGSLRDGGVQQLIFGIGPASGWTKGALAKADNLVSMGSMTLPQGIARVVLAEQIYRALTILLGHPYHGGH